MGVLRKKAAKSLILVAFGTLSTTMIIIDMVHRSFVTKELSQTTSDNAIPVHVARVLDDITERLGQTRQKVDALRNKLERMSLKMNSTEGVARDAKNTGLKRHLLDAFQLDQSFVTSDLRGTPGSMLKNDILTNFGKSLVSENEKHGPASFGCKDIERSRHVRYVGSGYTKTVEMVIINGTNVALKRPSSGGKDMIHCVESGTPRKDCRTLASYKVLKEAALLQQLNHPGIINLLGYCIKKDPAVSGRFLDPTLVTELGEPLDFLRLVQTPWEDKLRITLDLTRLLVYLADSPLGPLVMHDFKPTQFVLIKARLKLSDLDDLGPGIPPNCSAGDAQCRLSIPDIYPPCDEAGSCPGFADRLNLILAWQNFFSLQLVGGPAWLQYELEIFLNKTRTGAVNSKEALRLLNHVIVSYRLGNPDINKNHKNHSYQVTHDADLPGRYDYWCPNSRSPQTNSCVFAVTGEQEAKHICSLDDDCRAFILTNQTTWTGRYLVYLKNGFDRPVVQHGCQMFVSTS